MQERQRLTLSVCKRWNWGASGDSHPLYVRGGCVGERYWPFKRGDLSDSFGCVPYCLESVWFLWWVFSEELRVMPLQNFWG